IHPSHSNVSLFDFSYKKLPQNIQKNLIEEASSKGPHSNLFKNGKTNEGRIPRFEINNDIILIFIIYNSDLCTWVVKALFSGRIWLSDYQIRSEKGYISYIF